MNKLLIKEDIKIENLIYELRDQYVMLDSEIYATKCHYYIYRR